MISNILCSCLFLLGSSMLVGCNANSWMGDPAAIGYYKPTPTTIPILDRIDIIEEPSRWPQLSKVTPADLMPSDLTYRIAPADVLDVDIYGLYGPGQHFPVQRRVDQGGYFRVPEVGDVLVAGLTPQEAQDIITAAVASKAMTHPSVQVDVLDQTGFTYTVYGGLARWGVFTLRDPNLLLLEALAQTGGVPQITKNIYVIRQLPVTDAVIPTWDRRSGSQQNGAKEISTPLIPVAPVRDTGSVPNIEDLIRQLDIGDTSTPSNAEETPVTQETDPLLEFEEDPAADPPVDEFTQPVLPGILQTGDQELIDIDDIVPTRAVAPVPVDVDDLPNADRSQIDSSSAYIYVPESDSWIPVSTDPSLRRPKKQELWDDGKASPTMLERIIVIPWKRLRRGDSSYNIIIRPQDRIYVEAPPIGNLYIRGEVGRPGVYDYPVTGDRITLSQFITAAGDLGPIAVPDKVSLTRRIGDNLEATVTLNYAAILQHTEPDIFLKPNDHISVGTSWGATPIAIIRNGFRTSYGFGFLLDRNFGNDVFGAPPVANRF
jgi:protein involved in polysaccharide export with SLBB domain